MKKGESMQRSKPYKEKRINSKDAKSKWSNSRVQKRIRIKKHVVKSISKNMVLTI